MAVQNAAKRDGMANTGEKTMLQTQNDKWDDFGNIPNVKHQVTGHTIYLF